MTNPTTTSAWRTLQSLADAGAGSDLRGLFTSDPRRAERYSLRVGELLLDYSRNLVDDRVLSALLALAGELSLPRRIGELFDGAVVNPSEGRPALHMALRGSATLAGERGQALRRDIDAELEKVHAISEGVRDGTITASDGEGFTDVINIGIGGSDMGPRMVCEALREYATGPVRCHFIANVDGAEIHSLLARLDPRRTLVIVASKSFTTHETLLNADTTRRWLSAHLDVPRDALMGHFIAITENPAQARAFGVPDERVFRMWDWIGGRYSLWSSIGLAIAIQIGFTAFEALLAGAREMDDHFREAPLAGNMPVILALLGVWYRNFHGAETQAVVPYCERLHYLITHIQQLDMESSGKCVSLHGEPLDYGTGAVIWGQTGTNGQHSFFQLVHQGTHLVPVDFIGVLRDSLSEPRHHRALLAHMLAQAAALMQGCDDGTHPPERRHPGNRPSNTLLLDRLTPHTLGALVALYEHKVFAQGVIWNVNSFDQWGVELGKLIAQQLLSDGDDRCQDPATRRLLSLVRAAL